MFVFFFNVYVKSWGFLFTKSCWANKFVVNGMKFEYQNSLINEY